MKGFADIPEKKLIKNWLIPENRKYYRFKTKSMQLESLSMMINMWIALATSRYKIDSGKINPKATKLDTLTLIGVLDDELISKTFTQLDYWMKIMSTDDNFYIQYHQKLLLLVKEKIFAKKHEELSGAISITWEYKQWMQEAGNVLVTIKLIDNWLHPLSEKQGEFINLWLTASLMVGTATDRCQEGDRDKCIKHLISLGVLNAETDFHFLLQLAKDFDAEYLYLLNATKQAIEDQAFEKCK